jgi:hypothetical protein
MKTQELLKKRPKAGAPVTVETLKGGCRYFSVSFLCNELSLDGSFVVCGKPFHILGTTNGVTHFRAQMGGSLVRSALSHRGILPTYKSYGYLERTFKYSAKVWKFYKKIVEDQNLEAYKEAIKATL